MEIYELRYFAAVAKTQNIHHAAQNIHVSAPSLSKAISRLEEELNVKLFTRVGRHIQLTDSGRVLQKRANELLQLEESIRGELAGRDSAIQVNIYAPEILLARFAKPLTSCIEEVLNKSQFVFNNSNDADAIKAMSQGDAHFALVTSDVSQKLCSKTIAQSSFVTCVGKGHPLYNGARKKKKFHIDEILEYDFVSPNSPLLGKTGELQSLDGWRDDQFPRKIRYQCSSLSQIANTVASGQALAYLPDYYCDENQFVSLDISGCPYSCKQKIKLIYQKPNDKPWIRDSVQGFLDQIT